VADSRDNRSETQQRRHFRISYTLSSRAVLIVAKKSFPILDVSEGGAAFEVAGADAGQFEEGKTFRGQIKLLCDDVVAVAGKVLRRQDSKVILIFTQGVPLASVMKEQRFILQKFGRGGMKS
jgi:hypothetical protein